MTMAFLQILGVILLTTLQKSPLLFKNTSSKLFCPMTMLRVDEFILFFKSSWCNSSFSSSHPSAKQSARQEFNKFCPPQQQRRPLAPLFCIYSVSFFSHLPEASLIVQDLTISLCCRSCLFQPHACNFAFFYWQPKSRMGSQDIDGEEKKRDQD